MRAILVEDEPSILEGLLTLIDWKGEGFDCAGYQNAVDALEALQRDGAELVMTDLYMPVVPGLEFIRMAKEADPAIRFVILTGHDRFEYAQQAIELGIKRYLLKPVFPEELLRVVREIKDEILESRKLKNWIAIAEEKLKEYLPVMVSHFWDTALHGGFPSLAALREQARRLEIPLGEGPYCCLAVRAAGEGEEAPLSRSLALRQIMGEVLGESLLCTLEEGELVLAALRGEVSDARLRLLRLSLETNLGLAACFGVGRACPSPTGLHLSAKDAAEAAQSVPADARSAVVRYEDLLHWKKQTPEYPYQLEKQVTDMLRFRESLEEGPISRFLDALLAPPPAEAALFCLRFLVALYRLADEYSLALPPFAQAQEAIQAPGRARESLQELLRTCMREKICSRQQIVQRLVEQAKGMMEREYADAGLSVAAIAAKLCVTPNYLSRIFHSVTAKTCVEYLTGVRMEAAKKLLLGSGAKSYAIAQMTGYNNPNYFSALFKKHTGLSPREFRERGREG